MDLCYCREEAYHGDHDDDCPIQVERVKLAEARAEVELLRHDLEVQIRYSNNYAEAHARKWTEVERLREDLDNPHCDSPNVIVGVGRQVTR